MHLLCPIPWQAWHAESRAPWCSRSCARQSVTDTCLQHAWGGDQCTRRPPITVLYHGSTLGLAGWRTCHHAPAHHFERVRCGGRHHTYVQAGRGQAQCQAVAAMLEATTEARATVPPMNRAGIRPAGAALLQQVVSAMFPQPTCQCAKQEGCLRVNVLAPCSDTQRARLWWGSCPHVHVGARACSKRWGLLQHCIAVPLGQLLTNAVACTSARSKPVYTNHGASLH